MADLVTYDVDWPVFNGYVEKYTSYVNSIITKVNKVYELLGNTIMEEAWQDENAQAFVTWFDSKKALDPSFEYSLKAMKTVYDESIAKVCKGLNDSQKNTAETYAAIKENIAGGLSFTTNIANVFADKKQLSTKTFANKEKVGEMYSNVNSLLNSLNSDSEELANIVLKAAVGENYGVTVEGFVVSSAQARDVLRISVFTSDLKTQLDDCISKSAALSGIIPEKR